MRIGGRRHPGRGAGLGARRSPPGPGGPPSDASRPAKTFIRTDRGLQVDLRVVLLHAWGAALQYFTGSTADNVAVRQIAVRKKLRLSEYGLFT